jgi:hypothetical protein
LRQRILPRKCADELHPVVKTGFSFLQRWEKTKRYIRLRKRSNVSTLLSPKLECLIRAPILVLTDGNCEFCPSGDTMNPILLWQNSISRWPRLAWSKRIFGLRKCFNVSFLLPL